MMRSLLLAGTAVLSIGTPASAATFFTVGGAPDPGITSVETMLVTFDGAHAAGVTQTTSGTVATHQGTSGSAAAPAGDSSKYEAVDTGGISTFDFGSYFAGLGTTMRSLSVYLGSIDTYNRIELLTAGGEVVKTLNGADMPASNGDQGAAITNRRLYLSFAPDEGVSQIRFSSFGTAFEYDSIAASSHAFTVPDGTALDSLPAVPEPASWAMLITGFGLIGAAMRRRPKMRAAAAI